MRKFCIILSCIFIITGLLCITAYAVSMPPIEYKPTGLTINFVVETDGKKVVEIAKEILEKSKK